MMRDGERKILTAVDVFYNSFQYHRKFLISIVFERLDTDPVSAYLVIHGHTFLCARGPKAELGSCASASRSRPPEVGEIEIHK
jgi:hypothetical protein